MHRTTSLASSSATRPSFSQEEMQQPRHLHVGNNPSPPPYSGPDSRADSSHIPPSLPPRQSTTGGSMNQPLHREDSKVSVNSVNIATVPTTSTGKASSNNNLASKSKLAAQKSSQKSSAKKSKTVKDFNSLVEGLTQLYERKIKPIEVAYSFDLFHGPPLSPADIAAKPMVLLIGQYSVGKSTFVKHVLERDYPGIAIGPEPTTDRFVAVMNAPTDQLIPGNAAAVSANLPFTSLQRFGTSFLTRFSVSQCDSPLLEHLTLIDTPGILAGEKQSQSSRGYDFTNVVEWFAERSDLILLLFDSNKLDISDEFRESIATLKPHIDKVRVVLNKADSISGQQLMRVYGALMWSLGKVMSTPEVVRVYMGSFWDEPLKGDMKDVLAKEMENLLDDMKLLPRNAAMRKVNDIVKRARMTKVHALIISHLSEKMPTLFGKEKKQEKLLQNLEQEFNKIATAHRLAPGDFPDVTKYKSILNGLKLADMKKYSEKYFTAIDSVLSKDIPALMQRFPSVNPRIAEELKNPFQDGTHVSLSPWRWDAIDKEKYRGLFESLRPIDNKVSGQSVRNLMQSSGLAVDVLSHIWNLADFDSDGYLSWSEFVIAFYFIDKVHEGESSLPTTLPLDMVPARSRVLQ